MDGMLPHFHEYHWEGTKDDMHNIFNVTAGLDFVVLETSRGVSFYQKKTPTIASTVNSVLRQSGNDRPGVRYTGTFHFLRRKVFHFVKKAGVWSSK